MYITLSAQNSTGAWEVIETENLSGSYRQLGDDVEVAAKDIGGPIGQPRLVQLRDDGHNVMDSREIKAS